MPLNLDSLNSGAEGSLIEPRDIFAALPKRPWQSLRLAQGEVLGKWFDVRDSRPDVVIKQNTGGGKTVVGLLIAQSGLNEGVIPAVYLVPDTYLVQQVVDEAERLGISVATSVEDTLFRAGEATLVATFQTLVNGRSKFGVRGSTRRPISIGTLIIDDAHAALAASQGAFTGTIPANHVAYDEILKIFGADLKEQSARTWADIEAQDSYRSGSLRVPFWSWVAHQDEVLDILRKCGADDKLKSMFFSWPFLAEYLSIVVATVSSREIEIRTPCPPIEMIPSFATAKRRIYLTATLADDSVLITEFNAQEEGVRTPVTPARASDLGDRMIIAPLALNPQLTDVSVRELVRQFADGDRNGDGAPDAADINVVVLVPSNAMAAHWEVYADEVCNVRNMKPVIERLKDGEHIGVVVLVNKYDGVDLPDDACRLLVLDGVPTPLSPSEQRESTALAGGDTFLARTIQRIEQGMGRGVRDAEDSCAVLLLGNELAVSIEDPAARPFFSPATSAQIDLSRKLARQITGEGLGPIREALDTFLERDIAWVRASRAATARVTYAAAGHVSTIATARRRAFDLAAAGDYGQAADSLVAAIAGLEKVERGWYREEAAGYRHLVDAGDAQRLLGLARTENATTLRPIAAVPVRPLRANAVQAAAAVEVLAQYENATLLVLGIGAILDKLTWDEEKTDQAEAAFAELGRHLGFAVQRPDKDYGTGPDVIWAVRESEHALFELKTGVTRTSETIAKKEVDQLSGEIHWHQSKHAAIESRVPVLVHPYAFTEDDATAPPSARVITPEKLAELKTAVVQFAKELSTDGAWKVQAEVMNKLIEHKLTGNLVINAYSVAVKPIDKMRKGQQGPRKRVPSEPPAEAKVTAEQEESPEV